MIAYGVLPYTDIPPKERAWRSVQMLTPVTLSNGVNYHITVSRNGRPTSITTFPVSARH